ncbi:hypothetical protein QBC46DRAFT_432684, partial [Diplogelasinospora grovesii]
LTAAACSLSVRTAISSDFQTGLGLLAVRNPANGKFRVGDVPFAPSGIGYVRTYLCWLLSLEKRRLVTAIFIAPPREFYFSGFSSTNMEIKRVALVGANGNLGSVILRALLETSTFQVSALKRMSSRSRTATHRVCVKLG